MFFLNYQKNRVYFIPVIKYICGGYKTVKKKKKKMMSMMKLLF